MGLLRPCPDRLVRGRGRGPVRGPGLAAGPALGQPLPRLVQPLAGVVFVLDGVLIGAGDGAYLAWAGVVVLVLYAPAALLAAYSGFGIVAVWVAMQVVFMGARGVALVRRARSDAWLVTGAH